MAKATLHKNEEGDVLSSNLAYREGTSDVEILSKFFNYFQAVLGNAGFKCSCTGVIVEWHNLFTGIHQIPTVQQSATRKHGKFSLSLFIQ